MVANNSSIKRSDQTRNAQGLFETDENHCLLRSQKARKFISQVSQKEVDLDDVRHLIAANRSAMLNQHISITRHNTIKLQPS